MRTSSSIPVIIRVHAFPLTADDLNRIAVFRGGFLGFERFVTLRHDYSHRRSQLVGSVGGELLLRFKRFVQPLHHVVERRCELCKLDLRFRLRAFAFSDHRRR